MPPCCRTCRLPKHHIPRCRPERAPLPAHAYIPSQDELQEAGQSCTYPYLCDQTVGCRFSNLSNADAIEGHARPYPMYHVAWLQKEWIPGQIRSLAWTWTKVSPDAADTPDHLPPFPSPSSPFSFQQRCRSLVIRPLATGIFLCKYLYHLAQVTSTALADAVFASLPDRTACPVCESTADGSVIMGLSCLCSD